MYHFSATTLSFYPVELLDVYAGAGTLPDDLIEIGDDIYSEFANESPVGKMRGADKKGKSVWLNVPVPTVTADNIAATARSYRDAFIKATDSMMVGDYSIDDNPLTDAQRSELTAIRTAYRAWLTSANWPLIKLPELPQWPLIEAVNQGYRVSARPTV
ncbi:tail fiber assembly protein [Yersinia kristensenii]|uniref:tail fiber assembly protein n=1 Tax=Yersinia kristensenii TaxID=28152 RepID=UPI001C60EB9F|nr:tail fiber assembly protein [Yersinia kristensenii]MBW5823625.1 tail fiber assembly protein [Yersinia kristensenii]